MKHLTFVKTIGFTGLMLIVSTLLIIGFGGKIFLATPVESSDIWSGCKDSDAKSTFDQAQLFTPAITTYNGGSKTDYCYTFPNGKTYLFEGICKNGQYLRWQKNCAELNYSQPGANYKCINGACINFNNTTSTVGQLELSLSSNSPAAKLMAADTMVTLATFKFLAANENAALDYLYLTQVVTDLALSSYKNYEEIWFEDELGNEIAGTRMTPTNTKPFVDFANNAFVVKTSDVGGKVLYLKAKLSPIGTGYPGTAGHLLGYKINSAADVVAKGVASGIGSDEYLSNSYPPNGAIHYLYKAYPVFQKEPVSTNKLANGVRDLFKFKIQAVADDMALYKFTFDVSSFIANVSNLYLYDVTTGQGIPINNTPGTISSNMWETKGSDWSTSFPDGEIIVSKDQSRTFVLRGNITNAATGAVVVTGIAGDKEHIAVSQLLDTAVKVDSDSHNDFIWSDWSVFGHGLNTADWTNGYLVHGLASTTSTLEALTY